MERDAMTELVKNHEEADTKICLHSLSADCEDGNIVVRASDTDIAVILLYHCHKFQCNLWMDVGTASKNNRRFINISAIYRKPGLDVCAALPAFHAFTGSDYTSSFVRKGKVRPFKILEDQMLYQSTFKRMASNTTISINTLSALQKFTATLYGCKEGETSTSLNLFRYQKFMKAYGPKERAKNALAKL